MTRITYEMKKRKNLIRKDDGNKERIPQCTEMFYLQTLFINSAAFVCRNLCRIHPGYDLRQTRDAPSRIDEAIHQNK